MPVQLISHYRVVRRLGAGGMGEVLLAEDTQLGRSVAIKLMSVELAKDENQRKRFRTEARAASGLSHPNICVVHEVGETEDGRPFLAMEFVAGQTLADILQQRRLKIREIISLGAQVADALDAAHARRLVHRDIKPANIMVDARGHVKVLDFGLAKGFAQDELSVTTSSVALTQTGMLIGTPHYMSPEQALGRELDQRSDIFSLGVVLYELIAGQRPFLGKTVGETINNIVNQTPDSLGLENPIFSPALDGIIFKCLEKDPAKRYSSGKALAEDLNRLKVESERAMAGRETPVATPAPAVVTPTESTGLWELAGQANRKSNPALIVAIVAVLGLIALGGWALLKSKPPSGADAAGGKSGPATAQKSVAVLPFDNFSAEKDTEFLSDGLTEEITTALSRIPGLKVAARNSAFTFKGKKEDLRKVGAALGVTTLLEGSLRKAGRQMRVTAQLINVADGYHLWSETYDRGVDDIIAVQDEIARKIAERFELKVGGSESSASPARARAPNPDAYQLYLQGLHLWNKRTKDDLEKAARLFNRAIDQDPTYAAAYAGVASCNALLPDYASRPSSDYFPLARAAAAKALELDPTSADAYAVLGLVKSFTYDYRGSEAEFLRAIQLNPNHATAHHWYGVLLREAGRMDEALVELRRAEELDPLSPIIKLNILTWLIYARQYDKGIEENRKYLQNFPEFSLLRGALASFYAAKGQFKEAMNELEKLRATEVDSPYYLDALAYACARGGDEPGARKILDELGQWKKKGYAVRGFIALAHLGLREYDLALDSFEEAVAAGENVQGLSGDPTLDELRPHPRFQALLRKNGLK
jgi:TolB-like protein/tetratricopeptide (TPR) repeat protein